MDNFNNASDTPIILFYAVIIFGVCVYSCCKEQPTYQRHEW